MSALDDDVPTAREWWQRLEPGMPSELAGLWFGLFTAVGTDGDGARTLYVVGTREFDPDDETAEWAVGPYAWEPEGRYIVLPGLAALPATPHTASLVHAADVVRAIEPWGDGRPVGVAVGYDDGDLLVLHRG